LALGDLRELMVALARSPSSCDSSTKDYFVVLAMKPEGNLGRARYELRKAELMLAHEFTTK